MLRIRNAGVIFSSLPVEFVDVEKQGCWIAEVRPSGQNAGPLSARLVPSARHYPVPRKQGAP